MPKIPEYTSSVRLNSNDRGHAAYDALGRRISASYSSIAQTRRDYSHDIPYGQLASIRARSGALAAAEMQRQGEYDAYLEKLRNPPPAQSQGGGPTGFNARSGKPASERAGREVGDAAGALADAMGGPGYGGGGGDEKFNPLRYSSGDYGGYTDPNFVPDPHVKGVDKDGNPVTEQAPWFDIRKPVPARIPPGHDYSEEELGFFERFWSSAGGAASSVGEAALGAAGSVGSAISNIFAPTPGTYEPIVRAYAPIPPAPEPAAWAPIPPVE